jgi:hypothetical protein
LRRIRQPCIYVGAQLSSAYGGTALHMAHMIWGHSKALHMGSHHSTAQHYSMPIFKRSRSTTYNSPESITLQTQASAIPHQTVLYYFFRKRRCAPQPLLWRTSSRGTPLQFCKHYFCAIFLQCLNDIGHGAHLSHDPGGPLLEAHRSILHVFVHSVCTS